MLKKELSYTADDVSDAKQTAQMEVDMTLAHNAKKLLAAQLRLAFGGIHIFRRVTVENPDGTTKMKAVRMTRPDDINEAIDYYLEHVKENGLSMEDTYFYIEVRAPNATALKDSLERGLGKVKDTMDINVKNSFSLLDISDQAKKLTEADRLLLDESYKGRMIDVESVPFDDQGF